MSYIFGDYELDTDNYELRRAGKPCQIEPKAFDLLAYLIRQHGHVISKEELFEHLWPNQFVSESALSYCVMAARKAIGDSGEAQRLIKTMRGRGYRFIAPVEERLHSGSAGLTSPAPGGLMHAEEQSLDRADVLPLPYSALTEPPVVLSYREVAELVGREYEVGLLRGRWNQVQAGVGGVVLLSGEVGMGKSRLVRALKECVTGEAHVWLESHCSPCYQNSALYPVIDLWHRLLQMSWEETPQETLPKLERALEPYGSVSEQVIPLFASLLSLPLSDGSPPLTLTPRRQKQKTLEALLAWLLQEAQRQPVLFVVEDLHWVDPSTLEFLSLLIEQATTARLLVLLTFRPDFHPPWARRSPLLQIALSRLSRQEVEAMIEKLTGGKSLPAEVLEQLVVKADGVPLLVEELTKTVLELGFVKETAGHYALMAPLSSLALPATLQDALGARLDRLGTVKQVAQLGATLGLEFPYVLLQAVSSTDEMTLQNALARLVDAELLYQSELLPQARYAFRHTLTQNVAYQSLLPGARQQYHGQIARVLERRFPETREMHPELLAHHYTAANLQKESIVYWQKAAQRALERSAHVEALGHLTKGLESLRALLNIPAPTPQDLTLQITLGTALMAVKGYTAQEKEQMYARARELCPQVGEVPQDFQVLQGLWSFYLIRAEFQTARDLGEQCLRLAQSLQHPQLLLLAHYTLGVPLFLLGELSLAQEHLEQGFALYALQQHQPQRAAQDPGVSCLTYAASTLWLCGYPEQARQKIRQAFSLAQELAHPLSQIVIRIEAAMLHHACRESQAVQEQAEAAVALAVAQGWPHWAAQGTILRGWALAEQGQTEEGIAQIRQGLAAYGAAGAEMARPALLALLAEAYGRAGQAQEALAVLAEAFAVAYRDGEHYYGEAELYRLKGELLLAQEGHGSQVAEAEEHFRRALTVARHQQAKVLELRAAVSLSRLWQHQGRQAAAHQPLAEIYGWFTEGFDTADLHAAAALLEELG